MGRAREAEIHTTDPGSFGPGYAVWIDRVHAHSRLAAKPRKTRPRARSIQRALRW